MKEELVEGKTKYCEACEEEAYGALATNYHTCGLNPKETDGSQKCTCKIDKESNLTIDKACYWHGK